MCNNEELQPTLEPVDGNFNWECWYVEKPSSESSTESEPVEDSPCSCMFRLPIDLLAG